MGNENAKVKKMSKGLKIGIAVVAAAVLIGIAVWIVYGSMGTVAKVSDLKVTKQEYMVLSKYNINDFLYNVTGGATTADQYDWDTKVDGETAKDKIRKSTLDNIQEIKIQLIKAKEAGIELTTDDLKYIDDNINATIEQNGGRAATEKKYKEEYGVSLSEYKEIFKKLYLTQKYYSSEYQKVKATDEEVQKQYDDNKADYDDVTATHILFAKIDLESYTPLSEGKQAEAKKKADEMLAKVQAGEDINTLAEQNSDDTSAKENKGKLTFNKWGQQRMVAEFEEWCFDRKVGDVGIVETMYGYHVIKLQERKENKFEDVKDAIRNTIVTERFTSEFNKKMEDWKKQSEYAIVKNEKAIEKLDKILYPAKK